MAQLLTGDEVAQYLQVPVTSVSAWRRDGKGPASVRLGKFVRYRLADIDAWLDSAAGWTDAAPGVPVAEIAAVVDGFPPVPAGATDLEVQA